MTKFDQLAESQKNLQDMFAKFLEGQKPAVPIQKSMTIGDLNALVEAPEANATPLEKAIVSGAMHVNDGLNSADVLAVMQAAGGNAQLAQDQAMQLVRKSLAKRGLTAAAKVNLIDPGVALAALGQLGS